MGHFLPPPKLSGGAEELNRFFLGKGLHPYRLPVACEFVPGCKCCQSYLCEEDCKNDSSRICLKPAISDYGADLLEECEVLNLESIRNKITGVVCHWRGRQVTLRGKVVVLAAGALETPRILLNSATAEWPDGLANDSGMVGRNLMRHFIDLYAIVPKTRGDFPTSLKEIALNDYYILAGKKYGTVQSFGAMPPADILVKGMEQDFRKGPLPWAASLFNLVKPLMKPVLSRIFSGRIVLATIIEDLPYGDNRVGLSDKFDPAGKRRLKIQYRIPEYDHNRIEAFRKEIAKLLTPYSFMFIKQAENNERIAHACGTCRFGANPEESVLNANNRAHGVTNLYVVDASFFPSSGGTNPALTIAANALRVAEVIANALQ
jgi:choline dehydrogenase-like flavoprotein